MPSLINAFVVTALVFLLNPIFQSSSLSFTNQTGLRLTISQFPFGRFV